MKGKATIKGTKKAPNLAAQKAEDGQKAVGYAPAVPISVYRELAKELDQAKQQLSVATAHNSHLQQQNKALRQEVIRIIQSAAALKDILQAPPTKNPSMKTNGTMQANGTMPLVPQAQSLSPNTTSPNRVSEDLIAELDRSLAADIGISLEKQAKVIAPKVPDSVIQGPFCELVPIETDERNTPMPAAVPEPLFTEQPTAPPTAIALEDEEKSGILGGIWLPLTLVVVIVTAFSAGFLVVLPFIEADRNNN